jgi:hypothetical protein
MEDITVAEDVGLVDKTPEAERGVEHATQEDGRAEDRRTPATARGADRPGGEVILFRPTNERLVRKTDRYCRARPRFSRWAQDSVAPDRGAPTIRHRTTSGSPPLGDREGCPAS